MTRSLALLLLNIDYKLQCKIMRLLYLLPMLLLSLVMVDALDLEVSDPPIVAEGGEVELACKVDKINNQ